LREGYNLTVMRHSKMTLHQRWATFDCYGTLIDWDRGLAGTMLRLWPDAVREWLLARYHAVEPLIQEGRSLPYREVMARALRAIAAIEGLALFPEQEHSLSDSLSTWPAFPEVSASLQTLRDRGWKLAILSNTDPDLLAASLEQIGVVVDLAITAHEAGSYKPARGHWDAFYRMSGADPGRHVHVGASIFHDIAPAVSACRPSGSIASTGTVTYREPPSSPTSAAYPRLWKGSSLSWSNDMRVVPIRPSAKLNAPAPCLCLRGVGADRRTPGPRRECSLHSRRGRTTRAAQTSQAALCSLGRAWPRRRRPRPPSLGCQETDPCALLLYTPW
jgi:2-haloacid dehalogenase